MTLMRVMNDSVINKSHAMWVIINDINYNYEWY